MTHLLATFLEFSVSLFLLSLFAFGLKGLASTRLEGDDALSKNIRRSQTRLDHQDADRLCLLKDLSKKNLWLEGYPVESETGSTGKSNRSSWIPGQGQACIC